MSNYGYGGGRQNPYDQRSDSSARAPYPTGDRYDAYGAPRQQAYGQQPYGRQNQYNAPTMGRDEYAGQNVEMEPLRTNGQQFGQSNNSMDILSECGQIKQAISDADRRLREIQNLQRAILGDADTSSNSPLAQQLTDKTSELLALYQNLVQRIKKIKSSPESGSPRYQAQVGTTDRALKTSMRDYQNADRQYERELKAQMARQYKIVRPEASDQEVREAVEDTSNQQVFSQALLQGNRSGQARSVLNAVQSRHEEIQKIERQMEELAQLFLDMDTLVVQQEAAVTQIEMKGEEVVENMDKGTEQIGVAIKSARNARKWKWWCLGICVLIIIIIVVIVLLYQFVFGPNAKSNRDATRNKKRFVLPESLTADTLFSSSKPFDTDSKLEVPGLEWKPNNELVRKPRRFQA